MTVRLEGMKFHAFHGCLEEERREGNTFKVDIQYSYDAAQAAATDSLEAAVDYSAVYSTVRREMEIPSNLLENVAFRIKSALEARFPQMESLTVSVSKHNPPVGGECEWSTITC